MTRSNRKNNKLVLVEGDFDSKFFSKLRKKFDSLRSIEFMKTEDLDQSSNKKSIINFVKENSRHNEIYGFVDVDYDYLVDALSDRSELIPYNKNVADTSPYCDLNTLLISSISIEDYLLSNSVPPNRVDKTTSAIQFFGACRFYKTELELNQSENIVHFSFRKALNYIDSFNKVPNNSSQMGDIIKKTQDEKIRKNYLTQKFLTGVLKEKKITRTINRIVGKKIDPSLLACGHDVSHFLFLAKEKRSKKTSEIENSLINIGLNDDNVCRIIIQKLSNLWS